MYSRPLVTLRLAMAVVGVVSLAPAAARAASKIEVVAIGDDAPGGGQFLGPSLTGSPAAAGDGWVVFRTLVTEGSTTEQIVLTKLTPPQQSYPVAALGKPAGKHAGKDLGTFKQFLGRPTVNANGLVAFTALLTNSDAIPGGLEHIADAQPAAVFLFRPTPPVGSLSVVAVARDNIPNVGALDLTPIDDLLTGTSLDIL